MTADERECPCCAGTGVVPIVADDPPPCNRDCDAPATWDYHNPISGSRGTYCDEHLAGLRPDLSIETWVEAGYATPI
jgi:hypothetical protein